MYYNKKKTTKLNECFSNGKFYSGSFKVNFKVISTTVFKIIDFFDNVFIICQ